MDSLYDEYAYCMAYEDTFMDPLEYDELHAEEQAYYDRLAGL